MRSVYVLLFIDSLLHSIITHSVVYLIRLQTELLVTAVCFNLFFNALTDQLDLSLIGWVLLLLSRSLDSVRMSNSDDIERGSSKEREGSVSCLLFVSFVSKFMSM